MVKEPIKDHRRVTFQVAQTLGYVVQYEMFWNEQRAGRRVTFISIAEVQAVDHTNLLWRSDYQEFQQKDTLEINNVDVTGPFTHRGIGTALICECELSALAALKEVVGIGMRQTPDYEDACRLHRKLDYVADSRGPKATPSGDVVYY